MTYAVTMMKGVPIHRQKTLKFLAKLEKNSDFYKMTGTSIEGVYVSFGWPDFILFLKSDNVELIKEAIIKLRTDLQNTNKDIIETSTIICSDLEEIEKKKKEFFSKKH